MHFASRDSLHLLRTLTSRNVFTHRHSTSKNSRNFCHPIPSNLPLKVVNLITCKCMTSLHHTVLLCAVVFEHTTPLLPATPFKLNTNSHTPRHIDGKFAAGSGMVIVDCSGNRERSQIVETRCHRFNSHLRRCDSLLQCLSRSFWSVALQKEQCHFRAISRQSDADVPSFVRTVHQASLEPKVLASALSST